MLKVLKPDKTAVIFTEFYDSVVSAVSIPCYLTYAKLKSLEYIVFRHSKTIHAFGGDEDVYDFLKVRRERRDCPSPIMPGEPETDRISHIRYVIYGRFLAHLATSVRGKLQQHGQCTVGNGFVPFNWKITWRDASLVAL